MAPSTIYALFAVLLTIFTSASSATTPFGDFLAPIFSPALDELCKDVGCGKGKCKMPKNNGLEYECECDPGWMQTIFPNISAPKFLPCVIPNCTLNHSCSEVEAAAPAVPESGNSFTNASILDPCSWANCGGGVCNKKLGLAFACDCKQGYNNLLNRTDFPCFKECSFEGNCSNLGLTLPNTPTLSGVSAPPSPSLSDTSSSSNNNHAKSQHEALFNGIIVLVIAIAPLLVYA